MANTVYKVLGQLNIPTAATNQDLYTVPSTPATNTIVSTIIVTNISTANQNYSLLIRKGGAAANNSQYIAYNNVVPALDSIGLTLGLSLGAGDVVSANAGTASNVTISLYGTELS
jgi:hypothetical protein